MQKKIKTNSKNGFTLVEVLVAAAIFAIVMSIAMTSFVNSSALQKTSSVISDNSSIGTSVLEAISRDAKLANGDAAHPRIEISDDTLTLNYFFDGVLTSKTYQYSYNAESGRGTITYNDSIQTSDIIDSNFTVAKDVVDGVDVPIFAFDNYSTTVGDGGQIQPNLKVHFKLSRLNPGANENISQIFQTTITSRYYEGFNE